MVASSHARLATLYFLASVVVSEPTHATPPSIEQNPCYQGQSLVSGSEAVTLCRSDGSVDVMTVDRQRGGKCDKRSGNWFMCVDCGKGSLERIEPGKAFCKPPTYTLVVFQYIAGSDATQQVVVPENLARELGLSDAGKVTPSDAARIARELKARLLPDDVQRVLGCGETRSCTLSTVPTSTSATRQEVDRLDTEAHASFQSRNSADAALRAIARWQDASDRDPTRQDLRVRLAEAQLFYAEVYLATKVETKTFWMESTREQIDSATEQLVGLYRDAANNAKFALGLALPEFRQETCSKTSLSSASESTLEAAYWYAEAIWNYGVRTGIAEVLNTTDCRFALLRELKRVRPGIAHHGPARSLGRMYTTIPFPGGDRESSRAHFQDAMRGSPEFLRNAVDFAYFYLAKFGDRAAFERTLSEVLAIKVADDEWKPENSAQKLRARDMLEHAALEFD